MKKQAEQIDNLDYALEHGLTVIVGLPPLDLAKAFESAAVQTDNAQMTSLSKWRKNSHNRGKKYAYMQAQTHEELYQTIKKLLKHEKAHQNLLFESNGYLTNYHNAHLSTENLKDEYARCAGHGETLYQSASLTVLFPRLRIEKDNGTTQMHIAVPFFEADKDNLQEKIVSSYKPQKSGEVAQSKPQVYMDNKMRAAGDEYDQEHDCEQPHLA